MLVWYWPFMRKYVRVVVVVLCITCAGGCGFPRPTPLGGVDAADDGGSNSSPICTANQALRCNGSDLVRCNADGTAEVDESCALGCNATELRCNDVNPSNGLAPYLDMTSGEPDLDLGTKATINTDDGTVLVDGKVVAVNHAMISQASAPSIQVFIVHSVTTADVTITGSNALAIVSNGDVKVGGILAASATATTPGSGGFNDGACKGSDGVSMLDVGILAGSGGGGFGHTGGLGGNAMGGTPTATASGGDAGTATGNLTLVPLRGGCDGGGLNLSGSVLKGGAGGGAIQLVSRTKITVSGAVAANGSSFIAGGSGGGILLEAPLVEVPGSVVANGGGGAGGCFVLGIPPAEDGRLDAKPAVGGSVSACSTPSAGANGGNGGAGSTGATSGASNLAGGANAFGGHGGGSVGRIRVNTVSAGLHTTGLFSPNPTTGTIGSR